MKITVFEAASPADTLKKLRSLDRTHEWKILADVDSSLAEIYSDSDSDYDFYTGVLKGKSPAIRKKVADLVASTFSGLEKYLDFEIEEMPGASQYTGFWVKFKPAFFKLNPDELVSVMDSIDQKFDRFPADS
jgi:hypothetical protein